MFRSSLLVAIALGLACIANPALARVGPPVKVRWNGDWPAPARGGAELIGRFELVSGDAGQVENLRIEGAGWTIRGFDGSPSVFLPPQSRRQFTFRAVPTDPTAPIVVSGTVNGIPFAKAFRLDAERLATIGTPGRAQIVAPPAVLDGSKDPSARMQGSPIRFRGRVIYTRQDNLVLGVDNIIVRIMDDDLAPFFADEQIASVLTDAAGYFDVTVPWNDLDAGVPDDPDVYLRIEAANLVCQVRSDDTEDMYDWTTLDWTFTDYTGTDLQIGDIIPLTDVPALHVWNSMIKANRHASGVGGMTPIPHVFVHWPDSLNGAFYANSLDEIHIGPNETWTEGTQVHEYGHHLQRKFSSLLPTNYSNGFCDTPTPGHCVWCPENNTDAWQEGWANWFGSRMLRVWNGAYGHVPLSINDGRYTLETTQACTDGNTYPGAMTEGYVGALLRDIEDGESDGYNGFGDCAMDVLSQGDNQIFIIFRDDDPTTVAEFIQDYRTRSANQDLDFWHTIENVAPAMNFTRPALVVTSQPPSCRRVRSGQTIQFEVGSNSALARYRWRRNGVEVNDIPGSGVAGSGGRTLTLGPLTAAHSGRYECLVIACDASSEVLSAASELDVDAPDSPGPLVSWGVNGYGTVGDGTSSSTRPPYAQTGVTDLVKVAGGQPHTIALTTSGQVFTWGTSNVGELGRGVWSGAGYTPAPILSGVVDIAAGNSHGLALEVDGRIRSWGSNFYGQLFTGNRDDGNAPGFTLDIGCVRRIAAGAVHSLALLEDGTLRAIGFNGSGALGIGTTSTWELVPQQPIGLTGVVEIAAAGSWSMALRADGTVWTWGINSWGQLGHGHYNYVLVPTQVPGLTGIRQIHAGPDNAYALGVDGRLWAWGYGPAIGIGWTGGSSASPQLVPLSNVSKIVGGSSWAMALVNGGLKAWGLNSNVGQPEGGLFNSVTNYVVPSPIDVPGVANVTNVFAGWTTAHAFALVGVTDVPPSEDLALPAVLALAATPNPARATSSIHFDLPTPGRVALAVYDVSGRVVRTLADEAFEPGRHVRPWDGNTNAGAHAAAGVYFVRMSAPGGSLTRTVVRLD